MQRLSGRAELDLTRTDISTPRFMLRSARVAVTPRSAMLTARMPSGIQLKGANRAGHGGRGVYVLREWVEPELRLLPRILGAGDRFVDVGCCIGTYALEAAQLVGPRGGVLAVDPNPSAVAMLQANVDLNGLSNVVTVAAAAAEAPGLRPFQIHHERPDARGLFADAVDSELRALVQSVTVDDLTAELGWTSSVTMVKIDAEGAEARVLRGAARTLRASRPVVIAESAISEIRFASGYRAWSWDGSRNHVFVPDDLPRAEQVLRECGFRTDE